jgi:hypothetical protein
VAAVAAIGIGAAACAATPPPPDEDAYIDAIHTDRFDWLLPERPFIEEGYAACELLRAGHTEDQTTQIMYAQNATTGTEPEAVRERYRQQTVAAHNHLCPGVGA